MSDLQKPKTTPEAVVAELQALLPVSLEDQLRALVALWRAQADTASRAADTAARFDHYQEGVEGGKMMAYREVAQVLEIALDRHANLKERG